MDRMRFSLIAHHGLRVWNPLPVADTFRLIDTLEVGREARVLDVGCGRAELLIRLLERTGARGVGVDTSPGALALAAEAASGRVDPARLELRAEPFEPGAFDAASFEAALCLGSTHAAGGYVPALVALRRLVAPGGLAIVGEGFWRREPDAGYLEFLACTRDACLSHAGNAAAAEECGFAVEREIVSSTESFDAYEERYSANVERFVAANPADPDCAAFTQRIRAWRTAYLRWGRDTLGFALYVLRRR